MVDIEFTCFSFPLINLLFILFQWTSFLMKISVDFYNQENFDRIFKLLFNLIIYYFLKEVFCPYKFFLLCR